MTEPPRGPLASGLQRLLRSVAGNAPALEQQSLLQDLAAAAYRDSGRFKKGMGVTPGACARG